MHELSINLLKTINGQQLPEFLDKLLPYLYGYAFPELLFLFFVLLWVLMVLTSPQRGPKAAISGAIIGLAFFQLAPVFSSFVLRKAPFLNESLNLILRVEVSSIEKTFPVVSVFVFSGVLAPLSYYFPSKTLFVLAFLVFYSLGPVYLGASYPVESLGSCFLGFVLGYFIVSILREFHFFNRNT